MNILVLGGAGYIGSHTALGLVKAGHEVIIADSLVTGFRSAVPKAAKFYEGDIRNFDLSIQVQQLFQKFFNDLSRRTETQTFSWTVIDKFNNLGELIAGNIFK